MSFKLSDLQPNEKTTIAVDKAAAYTVWKECNSKLPAAELDNPAFTGNQLNGAD